MSTDIFYLSRYRSCCIQLRLSCSHSSTTCRCVIYLLTRHFIIPLMLLTHLQNTHRLNVFSLSRHPEYFSKWRESILCPSLLLSIKPSPCLWAGLCPFWIVTLFPGSSQRHPSSVPANTTLTFDFFLPTFLLPARQGLIPKLPLSSR